MKFTGGFEEVKYDVAFFSNKYIILINLPINKPTDGEKYKLFEESNYKKKLTIYKYKTKNQTNGFLTVHPVLKYINCEAKVFVNSCSSEYVGYTDENFFKVFNDKEYLRKYKMHSFDIVSSLTRKQHEIISTFILNSVSEKELSKANEYKNIEMLHVTMHLKSKVMKCYLICFSNMYKQMLVENKINVIPEWLIEDMENWLKDKNESVEVLLDMVKNYRMDYIGKDTSKYPGTKWDKPKNKGKVDDIFVRNVFNSIS